MQQSATAFLKMAAGVDAVQAVKSWSHDSQVQWQALLCCAACIVDRAFPCFSIILWAWLRGKTFHKHVLPSQDNASEIHWSIPNLTTNEFYMPAQDALAAMWNFARQAGLAPRFEDVAVAPNQDTAY